MKNKKLIVHIGYSKCGSTTIQDTLAANCKSLINCGVLFPKVVISNPSWMRFFWEKNLPVTYKREWVDERFVDFLKELRLELERESPSVVILSDEGLISLAEESVEEFKVFLECEFPNFEIHVVAIVREPVSFFTSRCQQFISDRYFDEIAVRRFLDGRSILNGELRADNIAMNPAFFYSKPLGLYDSIFSSVHILKFEEGIRDSVGLTHYFLQAFGIEFSHADIRKNESRSQRSIELISYINNRLPFSKSPDQREFRHYRDLYALHFISGNKFKLSKAIRVLIRSKATQEIDWIYERCAINYRDHAIDGQDVSIVWDEEFYQDIVRIYPDQGRLIKMLILSFVKERHKGEENVDSKKILKKLWSWIEHESPCLSKLNFAVVMKLILFGKFVRKSIRNQSRCMTRCLRLRITR